MISWSAPLIAHPCMHQQAAACAGAQRCAILPRDCPQLTLSGNSSSIRFGVEPQFFDLGLTPYDRPVERDLNITNLGGC